MAMATTKFLPGIVVAAIALLCPAYAHRDIILQACLGSHDPPSCKASLYQSNHVPPNATLVQVIETALWVSSHNIQMARAMVVAMQQDSTGNKNLTDATTTCLELLHYANYRVNQATRAVPRGNIEGARMCVSAALTYEYACWSRLKSVNNTVEVKKTMAFLHFSLLTSTRNALHMMANYDFFGDKIELWGPIKTERDGFWEVGNQKQGSLGFKPVGGIPTGLKPNKTVCKGGGCDYKTVQQAVDMAPEKMPPGKHFVIKIEAGVYEETIRVPLPKNNVALIGAGMGKTIITGSMSVAGGISTYNTATVGILADGFMASGLTIQNTAGTDANQAVAFRSDSDLSVVENCEFIGNQDTLYADNLRQYYKSCRIQGNVDFIFGNSAAFFHDCVILITPRRVNPENNVVTAHGRFDPAQPIGFVFQNCVINGTDEYMASYLKNPSAHKNSLGRPWKEYSRVVFINCTMAALVTPEGWTPWEGDFALNTCYFGEFGNTGPGSDTSRRVSWSSRIPADRLHVYSIQNFI